MSMRRPVVLVPIAALNTPILVCFGNKGVRGGALGEVTSDALSFRSTHSGMGIDEASVETSGVSLVSSGFAGRRGGTGVRGGNR